MKTIPKPIAPRKSAGKYAINSKEFRLAILIVVSTFIFKWTGFDVEQQLLDNIADINWEEWDAGLIATAFAILRYFFTDGKIIGLLPFGKR